MAVRSPIKCTPLSFAHDSARHSRFGRWPLSYNPTRRGTSPRNRHRSQRPVSRPFIFPSVQLGAVVPPSFPACPPAPASTPPRRLGPPIRPHPSQRPSGPGSSASSSSPSDRSCRPAPVPAPPVARACARARLGRRSPRPVGPLVSDPPAPASGRRPSARRHVRSSFPRSSPVMTLSLEADSNDSS